MTPEELYLQIRLGLPRDAPGDDASTLRALRMLGPLPPAPRILDLACGPGPQTVLLARETGGHVIAVDLHRPYLEALRRRLRQEGLEDRVQVLQAQVTELNFSNLPVDLIWAEGPAHVLGLRVALLQWRDWLKPRGGLATSELSWLRPDPPEEVRAFWCERQPGGVRTLEENLAMMDEAGYQVVGHFVLPPSSWWDEYYGPLERRLREARRQVQDRPDLLWTLDEGLAEIELYRRHGDSYGYVFYVLRKA
ncbi:MAG TPA: class I SAM-dependent methyltransferase [Candidatus Nitrosotenuis sp.]|jgi:SAM-dependent methyltransferase|nr:class I SAM-dependent methyltransferase [Candidatus Nitrosotenuis sp.]